MIPGRSLTIILSEEEGSVTSAASALLPMKKIETIPLIVIKKDQSREQFDRNKIQDGVMRACYKRPISVKRIENLIDEIETEVFNREEREIPSTKIGEIVMDKLKNLDAVAYVRFASVYREFKDIDTFMDELKKMMK